MIKEFFISTDKRIHLALLILRISFGLSLFIKHGIEKLNGFEQMKLHFPDPLHIGVLPGLLFAYLTDVICSIFTAFGFLTRIAALLIVINLTVAFIFFHKLSITDILGEQAYIYLMGYLTLFIAGPGKYSIDQLITRQAFRS